MWLVRVKNEAAVSSETDIVKIAAVTTTVDGINQIMTFKVGDRVVHPQHGVGDIVKMEERAFETGEKRRYYEVRIPRSGSTLWVPVDLPGHGLRNLAQRSEIESCRKVLASRPAPFEDDVRSRQSNLTERLRQGTVRVQCEVVRDLYAFGEHKSLYGSMAGFFRQTQTVLCEEWSLVEGVMLQDAVQEVTNLLKKSRALVGDPKSK
jgi:CarD family transcriptional regulator